MKEAVYSWIKCLAIFYILLTMLLHLVPTEKYKSYVRFFMGLVLMVMLITPVLSVLEKSRRFPDSFAGFYRQEEQKRLELEMENLQKNLLAAGMEEQLGKNIRDFLQKNGIEVLQCEVHIEGELLKAAVVTKETPDEEIERRIKDELGKEWGIRSENCEILSGKAWKQAVGDSSSGGTAFDSDRTSGIG